MRPCAPVCAGMSGTQPWTGNPAGPPPTGAGRREGAWGWGLLRRWVGGCGHVPTRGGSPLPTRWPPDRACGHEGAAVVAPRGGLPPGNGTSPGHHLGHQNMCLRGHLIPGSAGWSYARTRGHTDTTHSQTGLGQGRPWQGRAGLGPHPCASPSPAHRRAGARERPADRSAHALLPPGGALTMEPGRPGGRHHLRPGACSTGPAPPAHNTGTHTHTHLNPTQLLGEMWRWEVAPPSAALQGPPGARELTRPWPAVTHDSEANSTEPSHRNSPVGPGTCLEPGSLHSGRPGSPRQGARPGEPPTPKSKADGHARPQWGTTDGPPQEELRSRPGTRGTLCPSPVPPGHRHTPGQARPQGPALSLKTVTLSRVASLSTRVSWESSCHGPPSLHQIGCFLSRRQHCGPGGVCGEQERMRHGEQFPGEVAVSAGSPRPARSRSPSREATEHTSWERFPGGGEARARGMSGGGAGGGPCGEKGRVGAGG